MLKSPRTNSTFGFCRHKSQRKKNQKSCFLPTLEGLKRRMKKRNKKLVDNRNKVRKTT